jgi:hypothetical protein
MTKKIPKINVEQTKGNGKFYFYLYPKHLIHGSFSRNFQSTCGTYSPMCEL